MIKILNENQYFSTFDIALASAITTCGYPLESLDKNDPTKVNFFFKKAEGLDKIVQLFWQRKLPLDALSYFQNLKVIKSRIYSTKNTKNQNEQT